jgi:hypothetical protein
MGWQFEEKSFKNREEVKKEVRICSMASSVASYLSLLFAALGIISDAVNITLGLGSISWFLLSIIACLHAVVPTIHTVVGKHLLGIEAESKK